MLLKGLEYHRIDVWMGKGEDGLSRALNWGMRRVTGKVYFEKNSVASSLNYGSISSSLPQSLVAKKKAATSTTTYATSTTTSTVQNIVAKIDSLLSISRPVNNYSGNEEIKRLQRVLSNLGYYDESISGIYCDNTAAAVFKFQKERNVVALESDAGAGAFGPKTSTALSNVLSERKEKLKNFPIIKEEIHEGEKKEVATVVAVPRKENRSPKGEFTSMVKAQVIN